MTNHSIIGSLTALLVSLLLQWPVLAQSAEHDHEEEVETGIHGGRLFHASDFSLELALVEQGAEPQYRAWAFFEGRELATDQWQLVVQLTRLAGQVERIGFSSNVDFKLGDRVVEEPHSFDVAIEAAYQGQSYQWEYESHEGRVEMTADLADAMGISVDVAGPQALQQTVLLYGKISPDPKLVSHITARYPGLIRSVQPALGDLVSQGDLIATVEANDSLQTYEITAPISGIVVDSHANPGEYAGTQTLLTIANYRNVWADLNVFPGDAQRIRAGQQVNLHMGDLSARSNIRYLNPGEGLSPHVVARVPLDNPDLMWTPGLLIEGDVTVAEFNVNLAVDNNALQEFRDWQVVFIQIGNSYEIRPLQLGRSDERFTEVLSGLNPGDRYVVENSYLLKADLEKAGAAHAH